MKKLLIILGVLVALAVIAYFVLTSSPFIKAVVLPRVSASLNARVEAEKVSLRPFSSVEVRQLTIVPNGAEPLATVPLARVRYQLLPILRGNLAIREIFVDSPTITVVQNADGSSNLDPILRQLEAEDEPSESASATNEPIQLNLASLKVQNATLQHRATASDGSRTEMQISGLTVTGENLRNEGNGRIQFGAALAVTRGGTDPSGAGEGTLNGQVDGAFDLALTRDLLPASLNGRAETRLRETTGIFADFNGLSAILATELTPTELRRAALEFARGETPLGSISAQGPMNMATREANLQVNVNAIDRNVLNLAGAAFGMDFMETRLDSANQVTVAAGGQSISISGSTTGRNVAVRREGLSMPPIELEETYDLSIDMTGQSAVIRDFALNASQGGREVLRGSLSEPMQLQWGESTTSVPDASVHLVVTNLSLADWSALAGAPLQGTLNAAGDVGVREGGKNIALQVIAALAGLSGTVASNQLDNLNGTATADLTLVSFADPSNRRLVGKAVIENLTGRAADLAFNGYGVEATTDLALPEDRLDIKTLDLRLRQGTQPGGTVAIAGQWNTAQGSGELTITANGMNEAGIRPFLQPALGERELRSVLISGNAGVKLEPDGDAAVRAAATVTNLVVHDPAGTVPETPLAMGLEFDAGGSTNQLTIRKGVLSLTPTERAANVLQLTGTLDFSRTNALSGDLDLTSESLDLTRYFDLFVQAPADQPAQTPAPAPTPAPPGPQQEPEPMNLPIGSLTIDTRVNRLFLRQLAAEDLTATVKIDGSRVTVQPFQLRLNGAPVSATVALNLGVPGYEYDIDFSADQVPVKPFADSFVPALKGRIEGSAVGGIDIKGAGITGVNLKRTLSGEARLAVTNANLRLVDTAQKGVLNLLTRLLASALNIRELRDQPIMEIATSATVGNGEIKLTQAEFRSASLEASAEGTIPIADDLMRSPVNLPVTVALSRDVAQRARLVPRDAPTNTQYVALPPIASVKGTLGEPQPSVDTAKTALLVARGIGGLVGGEAGEAVSGVAEIVGGVTRGDTNAVGGLIRGLGNILGGRRDTNAPATNTSQPNRRLPIPLPLP